MLNTQETTCSSICWINKQSPEAYLAGDITDKFPSYDVWIFTSEQNNTLICSLLKFLLSIKSLLGFLYLKGKVYKQSAPIFLDKTHF